MADTTEPITDFKDGNKPHRLSLYSQFSLQKDDRAKTLACTDLCSWTATQGGLEHLPVPFPGKNAHPTSMHPSHPSATHSLLVAECCVPGFPGSVSWQGCQGRVRCRAALQALPCRHCPASPGLHNVEMDIKQGSLASGLRLAE